MGRAHEVRAASMAKTAAKKSKIYSKFGKELYILAKAGIPDPEMNQSLKRKISEAKANQVPADVIKRAIEKAKGSENDNYSFIRYEGFGPGQSTIIIDCLTDNTNRSYSEVKTCFNKSKAKIGVSGSVAFLYDNYGLLEFDYSGSEDDMLELLLMADIDVKDVKIEDEFAVVTVEPTDLHKTHECIIGELGEIEFATYKISMLPVETVELTTIGEKTLFERLLANLDDVDDVDEVFHNVVGYE
jgi:YebC/PmpR family DNA-binding regulatory protein